MSKRMAVLVLFALCALLALTWTTNYNPVSAAPQQAGGAAAAKPSPAAGYDIHVLAPHLVGGKQMGPYHHYCKVYTPDPKIVCLIYESTEPNAMLSQIEWIWAKKLIRPAVSRETWNKNWHDHTIEIAGGRVQVLDMPPDQAKSVADIVSTTDGLIYHFHWDKDLPNGKMSIAQAVGHKPMTAAEYKKY